ncbi:MAG: hypothetical protein EBR73_10195 [Rhodobacteraceae bacterium]|nr:hypothetical protein [Paracoccaceae bacterium]
MGKMRAIRVLAPEFIIFSAYLCAFSLSVFVILPLQSLIFGSSLLGSLLFMGHGVRVLSVWLFGIRAIAPLAVAEWLATVLIWQPAISMDAIVLGAVVGAFHAGWRSSCCAWRGLIIFTTAPPPSPRGGP